MTNFNFLYQQTQLKNLSQDIIAQALELGATDVQVELSESISTDIEVLNGQIENFETSHENQALISVFKGHKKGCVGISNISSNNIKPIILQALDIATFTQEDECNGILEKEFLAINQTKQDLQLFDNVSISNQELIRDVLELEQLATKSPQIKTSDGASISLTAYNFTMANSNGFCDGYQTSRFSKYVSLIGENSNGMQTDYDYDSRRVFHDMRNNLDIAKHTQDKVIRRLHRSDYKLPNKPTVIFESSIAKSIIGSLLGAISGNSLYRKLSFLNDSLNTQVLPSWVNVTENPFIARGLSSCYFDNEGCIVKPRNIIDNGIIKDYLLTGYTARKLNMKPTGNSGGSHNLSITSNFSGDITKLAAQITDGIVIIETIGHGLNSVTGDYSVGASGLIIKNGIIDGFVDNLTIAGNMRDIFKAIQYISDDYNFGSVNCGSMLIDSGVISLSI